MVHNLLTWANEQSCKSCCRQKGCHEVQITEAILQVNVEVSQAKEEINQKGNKSVKLELLEWDQRDLLHQIVFVNVFAPNIHFFDHD